MADVDVDQLLEGWCENNLSGPANEQSPGEMVEVCTAEAAVVGISANELTRAAGGNLAAYLAERHLALTER
jgi:hypothetical protein